MSIEVLTELGIPTTNAARAVRWCSELKLPLDKANAAIKRIAPCQDQPVADLHLAHLVLNYLVQAVVTHRLHDVTVGQYQEALANANVLRDQSYLKSLYGEATMVETTTTIDEDGNEVRSVVRRTVKSTTVRVKDEESGMDKARRVAAENPSASRSELADLLVAEGLRRTTVHSYLSVVCKGDATREASRKGKKSKGSERKRQVQAVFDSRPSWSSRAELIDALVADGMLRTSANTFSYHVMPGTKKTHRTKKADAS